MKTIIIFAVSILIVAPLSARAADAKTNWANNCAQCHGPDGKANTKMGKTLSAKDLTDPKVQAEFTDAKATQSIKEGVKQNGKTTTRSKRLLPTFVRSRNKSILDHYCECSFDIRSPLGKALI